MQKKNFWTEFSWVMFFVIVLILLKICIIGLYLIPSPSMLPELLPGDRIIANKLSYGFHLPFMQNALWLWSFPKRGDTILFSFSDQDDVYVKRVIGIPGDLISFQEGKILINGEALVLKKISAINSKNLNMILYQEENPHFFKNSHLIYLSAAPEQTFFESRRFLVPPGKLFVLGDNRDNSADSRMYGYVDSNRVYGKISFVLFSSVEGSFLPKFLPGRFFKEIMH